MEEKKNKNLRRTNLRLQEALAEVHTRLEQVEQCTRQLAIAWGAGQPSFFRLDVWAQAVAA